jgi:hypothetical protein
VTLVYILNAYFREAHKNRVDLTSWIEVLPSVGYSVCRIVYACNVYSSLRALARSGMV